MQKPLFLCALVVVSVASPLAAQDQNTARASGTIKAMQNNVLHVVSEEGDQWWVQLPRGRDAIRMEGTAVPGWLRPGMWIRFVGKFNKRGVGQSEVSQLEVFVPPRPRPNQQIPEEDRLGIFPLDAGLGAGGNLFGDPSAKPAKPADIATYRIAGQLRGVGKDGKMLVAAGNMVVRTQLSDDAEVKVNTSDLRLAQPRIGDRVSVTGRANPLQKNQIFASYLTVSAAKKLGLPDEPKKDGAADSKPAK